MATRRLFYSLILVALLAGCAGKQVRPPAAPATPAQEAVLAPTAMPALAPTVISTAPPTAIPTVAPTATPTPSATPTTAPTAALTTAPSASPTPAPTSTVVVPTLAQAQPERGGPGGPSEFDESGTPGPTTLPDSF